MRYPLYLVILLAFASLAPRTVHAGNSTEATAKAYYERGQQLFALQQFDGALEQFQLAFDTQSIPELLFNIGQCHRNLGDYDAAMFAFKRYLQLVPAAPNRTSVEKLIAQLEDKKATLEAFQIGLRNNGAEELPQLVLREPVFMPPPPAGPRPFYKKWWFWTGIAAVGAAGGITFYAATRPPQTDLGHVGFGE